MTLHHKHVWLIRYVVGATISSNDTHERRVAANDLTEALSFFSKEGINKIISITRLEIKIEYFS